MNGTWKDEYFVKILDIRNITHDVKRFRVTKPDGYQFIPGEATDIVMNRSGWKDKRKPFTFTGLNEWAFLEFTIKIYQDHHGFTDQLDKLMQGDELILHDSFGAFSYRREGTFIAGGTGVTPFIAILRQLKKDRNIGQNRLIFSNKTTNDILLKEEFDEMLGHNFINIITRQWASIYDNRMIMDEYLSKKIPFQGKHFYICGPDAMVENVMTYLLSSGVERNKIITENVYE